MDNQLNDKVNASVFNEANQQRITVDTQIEQTLLEKLNTNIFNTQIALKANTSDIYNQQQINDLLNNKISVSTFNDAIQQKH